MTPMSTVEFEPKSLQDKVPSDAEQMLRVMLVIREFEDSVLDLFSKNLVRGSTHLCQGQEAIAVGVTARLAPSDTMTCTYRGHGAVIAKGAPIDRCFGELLGRAGGLCGGKGGSMHFTDFSVGALGANAIVGAHLPISCGAALTAQYLGTGAVSVAFFGDGASNIGAFHEALNLAAIWKLPVLFVLENNQYGEYSPVSATTPISRLVDRAESYGMPGLAVDGNDVASVASATEWAVDRARAGDGPTLIEADTYRQVGHSRSDPGAYRPDGELDSWLLRDPIKLLSEALIREDEHAEATLVRMREEVRTEVQAARDAALSWPEPSIERLYEDVFSR
jgi:acetoin:2,6-dichlorophenolindophenol oxidoreductase subunit alpha